MYPHHTESNRMPEYAPTTNDNANDNANDAQPRRVGEVVLPE